MEKNNRKFIVTIIDNVDGEKVQVSREVLYTHYDRARLDVAKKLFEECDHALDFYIKNKV